MSSRTRITRRLVTLAVAMTMLVGATSACSTTLASLPVPDGQPGPFYDVDIEFSNVLNISMGAKVLADGTQVGKLDSVTLGERTASAKVKIDKSVTLPVETVAELRQGTLLGDLYIALTLPTDASGANLSDGGVIPLAQTSPPDNVETVFIGLGQMINGGVITRIQQLMRQTNDALPEDPAELSRIVTNATQQVEEVGASTDALTRLLDDGSATVQSLADHADTVERTLTIGPDRFAKMQSVLLSIVDLIEDLIVLTKPGGDLLPVPVYHGLKEVIGALDPMVATFAEIDRSLTTNGELVSRLIAKKLGPFFTGPTEVNIVNVDQDGRAVALADFLRSIGMV